MSKCQKKKGTLKLVVFGKNINGNEGSYSTLLAKDASDSINQQQEPQPQLCIKI